MERPTVNYLMFGAVVLLLISLNFCQCTDQLNSAESAHKKNSTGSRYCGNSLVRAMRLICDGYYAEPSLKRSLDSLEPKYRLNRKYKIWKQKFNLKDTDLTTWPELDKQYQQLFGSEVHQNNHQPFIGVRFNPFKGTYVEGERKRTTKPILKQDPSKLLKLRRLKRGIYEECCKKPCTVKYMRQEYCYNGAVLL